MVRTAKNKVSKTDTAVEVTLGFEEDSSQSKDTGVSFEEALAKLEVIVKELEAGELPLEESLSKFAEGVSLSKMCLNKLNSAQAQIDEILKEKDGRLSLEAFKFQEGEV